MSVDVRGRFVNISKPFWYVAPWMVASLVLLSACNRPDEVSTTPATGVAGKEAVDAEAQIAAGAVVDPGEMASIQSEHAEMKERCADAPGDTKDQCYADAEANLRRDIQQLNANKNTVEGAHELNRALPPG